MTSPTNHLLEMPPGLAERLTDKGVRHLPGAKPEDYLRHWLTIGRQLAFATQDGSWGEFEKEFAIIVGRLVRAEQRVKNWIEDNHE